MEAWAVTTPNELDRYAEMDDAKAKALIDVLVKHQVALVPTLVINFPGYPKDWARFVAEGRQLFTDPDLRSYYPQSAIDSVVRPVCTRRSGGGARAADEGLRRTRCGSTRCSRTRAAAS